MKYRYKSKRYISNKNNAVAGVIEALLLIGLVAIILSIIQLYYIPEIMEEKEAEHMDVVSNQFSQLKSVIDSQSLMGVIASDQSLAHAPMSTPITLGSRELPYFVSARSTGQVEIIDRYEAVDSKIVIDPATSNFTNGIPLTSIVYMANNYYYLQGSTLHYILEGGGIFLEQRDGGTVLVKPGMSAEIIDDNTIKLIYDLPLFRSFPAKNITGGYADCYVRTNYSKHYEETKSNVQSIKIYTDYLVAWNQSLYNDSNGVFWDYSNYINVEYDNPTNPIYLEIKPKEGKVINIDFSVIEIEAQTGPGIIYKD